jgi:tripartite-type tricarboxylate transporter receptor subunit TctC
MALPGWEAQHIAGEAFDVAAGVKGLHVPYKAAPAHLDLIGGNIQMMSDTTSSAMSQIKGLASSRRWR